MMKAALVVAVCGGFATPAWAEQDPFSVLRDGTTWDFDVVEGASVGTLKPVKDGPHARCRVEAAPPIGSIGRAKLVCEPIGTAVAGRFDAFAKQIRSLAFDDAGVREVVRGFDDAKQLAERGNAGAFTFPRRLAASGPWTHDTKGPTGARALVIVHAETAAVRDKRETLWVSDAKYWGPPIDGKPAELTRSAAAFAPGAGPVLLCAITGTNAKPTYSCLRQAAPTGVPSHKSPGAPASEPVHDLALEAPKPTALISLGGKVAHDKSSLKADAVASKVRSAYVAALRRCYRALLQRKPAAKGALELTFTVNAVGKTEQIDAKAFDDGLAACARSLIATWRFGIPMSEYGEPRTARFTLELRLAPE